MATPKEFERVLRSLIVSSCDGKIFEYGIYSSVDPFESSPDSHTCALSLNKISNIIEGDEKASVDYIFPHIKDNLIYDERTDDWYRWNINHWQIIKENSIYTLIQEALNCAYSVDFHYANHPNCPFHNSKRIFNRTSDISCRWENIGKIKNIITFLKSHFSNYYSSPIIWNELLYLLPALIKDKYGKILPDVIDLRTGDTIPAKREDYLSRYCPTEYKGMFPLFGKQDFCWWADDGKFKDETEFWEYCKKHPQDKMFDFDGDHWSLWDNFQYDITGIADENCKDQLEQMKYRQRFWGMSLMTKHAEQKLLIVTGEGSNGKSIEYEVLSNVLGDSLVYTGVSVDILDPANANKANPYLVQMGGKSFVVFSESDEGNGIKKKLSASLIKRMTGESKIMADAKYKNPVDVAQTYTSFLMLNDIPSVSFDDSALMRRFVIDPHNEKFVENPDPNNPHEHLIDTSITKKILEKPSEILAWLVRGCVAYWNNGNPTLGEMPTIMKSAINQLKSDNNRYEDFIEDECILDPKEKIKARELYKKFATYCARYSYIIPSETKFGKYMSNRKGITKTSGSTGNWYHGISA